MFGKILIANRGEIAVRILRTCRELHIPTVALYEVSDSGSLHVRMADECVLLDSPKGFMDPDAILEIARAKGADAIHPGYGFLAEEASFAQACQDAGLTFIGPPAQVLLRTRNKVGALVRARNAGFPTLDHSPACYEHAAASNGDDSYAHFRRWAEVLGYPVIVKPCIGGRGRGERLAQSQNQLEAAVDRASAEAMAVYGDSRVYLEKAILPSRKVSVQIAADHSGSLVHLGDRQGLVLHGSQKVIEEAPASSLSPELRQRLLQAALDLAQEFAFENLGTVEFLVDEAGQYYFSEIKARIQVNHPLTEMVTRLDLVREQIRIAAGEPLNLRQEDIQLQGCSMLARVSTGDPWSHYIPEAGMLQRVRLPNGPEVRVDTTIYSGYEVPSRYDPLLAKVATWGPDREVCISRMARALDEFQIAGPQTNLPALQLILRDPDFATEKYPGRLLPHLAAGAPLPEERLRDLAVAAAILYIRQNRTFQPVIPPRLMSGWHRDSRQI